MEYEEVQAVVKALVEMAQEKGEQYKEGKNAYALGWVETSVIGAICKLSNKQRKIVCDDIASMVEWAKKSV